MKNMIFLAVFGLLLLGSVNALNYNSIQINSPASYTSPETGSTINVNITAYATATSHLTSINVAVLTMAGVQVTASTWTNSNISINSSTQVFAINGLSSGLYKINASMVTNASVTNYTIIDIYPQTTQTANEWQCTPPVSCYAEHFSASSGENFYISSNWATCPNLGLGQMNSNYWEQVDLSTSGTGTNTNRVFNGTTNTHNNKRFERYIVGMVWTGASGTDGAVTNGDYRIEFKYNLSGSLTHNISWTNMSYVNSCTGAYFRTALYQNTTLIGYFSTPATTAKTLADAWGLFNSTGLYLSNGTNYLVNFGPNDIVSLRVQHDTSTTSCPHSVLNMNLTITNAFLEEYIGYGGYNMGTTLDIQGASPPVNLTIGESYNATAYLSACPILNPPPYGNITGSQSKMNISNPQPTVSTLLYYNSQVVYPYIYYVISATGKTTQEATLGLLNPNVWNPATTVTKAYNNSVTYVYSKELASWFLVPPFNLDPASGPYITNLVYDTGIGGGTTSTTSAIPQLPVIEQCGEVNGTYYIRSNYTSSMTFQTDMWHNASYSTNMGAGTFYNFSTSTTNLTVLNFYVNGYKRCAWTSNQSLAIGGITLTPDLVSTNLFFDITLMLLAGLSTISPAILLVAMAYNDFFSIIPVGQMAFLTVFIAIIAYITNWWGQKNLKTTIALVAMGIALLVYFQAGAGNPYTMTYSDSFGNSTSSAPTTLDNINTNIQTLTTATPGGITWLSLALSVTTGITLIINIFVFLIQVPFMAGGIVLGLLFELNPMIATQVAFFLPFIMIGLVGWLVLKAYDMFQKPNIPS